MPASSQPVAGIMNRHGEKMRRLALIALSLAALACVQACREEHQTLLHKAVKYDEEPEVIRKLVASGSDVNARTRHGQTPLHYAARFNHEPSIAEALIAAGADVNARDENGSTPLNYTMDNKAAGYGAIDYHHRRSHLDWPYPSVSVIKALLAAGADANAHDDITGFTPLHGAALHQAPSIVEMLVAAGADVNAYDKYFGMTPLHGAIMWGAREGIVGALLAAGADVNAVSKEPDAEYLWVLRSANWFVDALLGVASIFTDVGNEPTYDAARGWRGGNTPLLLLLHTHLNPPTTKMLIEAGADVNARDEGGLTPLLIVKRRYISSSIMDMLIDAGADVNAEPLGVEGGGVLDAVPGRYKWIWLATALVLLLAMFMIWRKFRAPVKSEVDPGA